MWESKTRVLSHFLKPCIGYPFVNGSFSRSLQASTGAWTDQRLTTWDVFLLGTLQECRIQRKGDAMKLGIPLALRVRYGERSFSVAAPRIGNTLPDEVKISPDFSTFRSKLKTHLCKIAFVQWSYSVQFSETVLNATFDLSRKMRETNTHYNNNLQEYSWRFTRHYSPFLPAQKSFILFYFAPSSGQINNFI